MDRLTQRNTMPMGSKPFRTAWRAANPQQEHSMSDEQFSTWMRAEKAAVWDLAADHQARRDGAIPDLTANPWRQ